LLSKHKLGSINQSVAFRDDMAERGRGWAYDDTQPFLYTAVLVEFALSKPKRHGAELHAVIL
jgi:hypothetical protein